MKKKEKLTPHIITVMAFVVFIVLGLACASAPKPPKLENYKMISFSEFSEIFKNVLTSKGRNPPKQGLGFIVEGYFIRDKENHIFFTEAPDSNIGIQLDSSGYYSSSNKYDFLNLYGTDSCETYHVHPQVPNYNINDLRKRIDETKKCIVYIGFYLGYNAWAACIDKIEGLETIAAIEARRMAADEEFGRLGTPNSQDDFDVRQNAQGGITITGYKGTRRWVIIPDMLYGQRVTQIGSGAFSGKNLTNIIIPNTVTHIEFRAFTGNSELTDITLPDALIEIEASAFLDCGLTNLRLGSRIQKIGMAAFGRNKISTLVVTSASTDYGAQSLFGQFITTPFEDNPLSRVTLPANMSDNNVRIINMDLGTYYISQGKRAGTYVKNGPVWARE